MTLILPLLISNGSWGSSLPECEGSPSEDVSISSRWDNCQGTTFFLGLEYTGEFKGGQFHGQGTSSYNGEQYVGEYKDGSKHGQGTYTSSDGHQYVGEYQDGQMHGQGTFTANNGYKMEGIFKENEFLYENIAITNEDKEFCQEIGFKINTPEYDNCVQKTAERD